jgi:hypothetical protein
MTILHHLRALEYSENGYDIVYDNVYPVYLSFMTGKKRAKIRSRYTSTKFDAVILHYSFLGIRTIGWPFRKLQSEFDWIADLPCLKIAIPQDEGDYAAILDEWLFKLGVTVIFSVHYSPHGPLYPIMRNHAVIRPCLPGYIDENTAARYRDQLLPMIKRPYDIVYRARKLPLWYGSAGLIKSKVAEVVAPRARTFNLRINISTNEQDTIPGDAWLDFIASGKVVLGTEGGYSVIDWRGEVKAAVKKVLDNNPQISLSRLQEMMPTDWDNQRLFTVTPRHFEAIITKTCQVLVEGDYKGVLIPHRHYIPISQDWSNLDEVLEKLRDSRHLQVIAERAYEEILLDGQYSYRAFANEVEKVLENNQFLTEGIGQRKSDSDALSKAVDSMDRQLMAHRQDLVVLEAEIERIIKKAFREEILRYKPKLKVILLVGFALAILVIILILVLFLR